MSALHRRYVARKPVPFTITLRKEAAQRIRRELAAYVRTASDDSIDAIAVRARLLDRVNKELGELLMLEGLDR